MRNALYVLLGVMAGFVLAGLLIYVARAPAGETITLQPAPTEAPIAVHVIGAVPRPGLYEFAEGARVQDAIDAAGGLLASANPNGLNLAALLEDGQQLDVPYGDGQAPESGENTFDLPASTRESPIAGTEQEPEPRGMLETPPPPLFCARAQPHPAHFVRCPSPSTEWGQRQEAGSSPPLPPGEGAGGWVASISRDSLAFQAASGYPFTIPPRALPPRSVPPCGESASCSRRSFSHLRPRCAPRNRRPLSATSSRS